MLSKAKEMSIKIANFLRLLDENGLLSLTNIAVIIMLAKIALSEACDVASFATLLTALGGYHFKRFMKTKEPKAVPQDQIDDLKSQLNSIKLKMGIHEGRLR